MVSGVFVGGTTSMVGVHEGVHLMRGVSVAMGVANMELITDGGKGLKLLDGFIYIRMKAMAIRSVKINTRMVNIFHANPAGLFLLGSFTSE